MWKALRASLRLALPFLLLHCVKAGHPWVEDPALELRHELLTLTIAGATVAVEARLDFALLEEPADRVVTFPIPPPCQPAEGFVAELAGPGRAAVPLRSQPAPPGLLPVGEVAQAFDIELPAEAMRQHGGALVVRYRQRCAGSFRYSLRTGAYWSGPIGVLEVVIVDPEGRLAHARLEGKPPEERSHGAWRWQLTDVEPRWPLELGLLTGGCTSRPP